jgi:ACR3 family arsenite transporter
MRHATATMAARRPSSAGQLSTLDRWLPVWIFLAMALGIALGKAFPDLAPALDAMQLDTVSLPIAIGLLWMMYPVLARVNYATIPVIAGNTKLLATSLVLNWVLGPALMFVLAWVLLPDHPDYRTGVIIVGLARCIAMVLIWNMLACGNHEYAAVLVALNSAFQLVMYTALGSIYLMVVPQWLGAAGTTLDLSMWAVGRACSSFWGFRSWQAC